MIKIGLIGAGHLGRMHLKLLREIPRFEVVGFFDSDRYRAEQIQKEFSVPAFNSVEDMIAACDALDIVTPTVSHHQYAIKALKNAKHIFIEKPISTTPEEAKQIMALADEADRKVQIGHVERFNPAFLSVQKYFDNPMFIETHRLAQFNPRGTDVSVVLDLMIHDIDIVLSVVKSNVKKINASGVAVVSDTPDICNARIEFDNGAVANITASRMSMKNMRKSRFFQRDAYLSVDFLEKKAELIRMKQIAKEPEDPFAITIDLAEKGMKQIFFDNPQVEETNAIKMELESFADSILNDKATAITAEDGFRALEVAFKVMEKTGVLL
ncbi:MAG: Gfo/Idh/MocA family oxidoreductase [Bacteroidetes bacterium]|nr:MAG: Gfo/Idh/MocA family oxidoreductase [Bacteroidota bacterium]